MGSPRVERLVVSLWDELERKAYDDYVRYLANMEKDKAVADPLLVCPYCGGITKESRLECTISTWWFCNHCKTGTPKRKWTEAQ
jgi:hypothetical protein